VGGTSVPAHNLPVAAVRTAGALGRLPDSGLVVRMTRGRAWIVVLGLLLTGIVALNVVNLSLGASQGKIGQQAQILEQENSALRARLAHRLSSPQVRSAAASLGMTAPAPHDIDYRDASPQAVKLAVRRLAAGFGTGASLVTAPTTTTTAPTTTYTTSASAPTTTTTTPSTSAAPAPTTSASVAPIATSTSSGGGVAPG
jgi:hypothetical protein